MGDDTWVVDLLLAGWVWRWTEANGTELIPPTNLPKADERSNHDQRDS